MSELCAEFGVSRQTGYKWLARYRAEGVEGLKDRSRAPLSHGLARDEAVVEAVWSAARAPSDLGPQEAAQKAFRTPAGCGAAGQEHDRRLAAQGGIDRAPPAAAAVSVVCFAVRGRRRRQCGLVCRLQGLVSHRRPPALRSVDTISDAMSRYLLRCEAVARPDGAHVRPVFEAAFCEFGLPLAIRSDNGPPFASTGAGGLSRLAVWWIKLGVKPERIEPGKPQQNGRHERMHRTLKAETADPPAATLSEQQRRFDAFRAIYNDERPHDRPWPSRRRLRSIVPPNAPTLAHCASRPMATAPQCVGCARTAKSNGAATSSSSARR